jgi:hypothetical protein
MIEPSDVAEAEATRRKYLSHEASVQSVGSLHYLGAIFAAFAVIIMIANYIGQRNVDAVNDSMFLFIAAVYAIAFGINLAMGIGLRGLKTWARWVEITLVGLSLAYCTLALLGVLFFSPGGVSGPLAPTLFVVGFGYLILGYILYLLVSPKGSVVFAPEYKEVIARTPHVKYKTSCLVKAVLLLILIGIVMRIVAAIVGMWR